MNKFLLILFLLSSLAYKINAQTIRFEYDTAGNQIKRSICGTCKIDTGKKEQIKEITALVEEDLQKFSPEDSFSYYPNPVREELYLKWELANDNYIKSLQIYNFNGQLLKSFSQSNSNNSQTISFQSYPSGIYLIDLHYSNGEQKTIKIIKK